MWHLSRPAYFPSMAGVIFLVSSNESWESVPTVNVRLWHADAVVLYDWLMSTDLNAVPITHRAQKQALVDLAGRFEWACDVDVTGCTELEIAAAQEAVARAMGPE